MRAELTPDALFGLGVKRHMRPGLGSIARFNPTAFQAVSFQLNSVNPGSFRIIRSP
jgi:hypothetical protein